MDGLSSITNTELSVDVSRDHITDVINKSYIQQKVGLGKFSTLRVVVLERKFLHQNDLHSVVSAFQPTKHMNMDLKSVF